MVRVDRRRGGGSVGGIFGLCLVLFLDVAKAIFAAGTRAGGVLIIKGDFSFSTTLRRFLPVMRTTKSSVMLKFPCGKKAALRLRAGCVAAGRRVCGCCGVGSKGVASAKNGDHGFSTGVVASRS